MLHAQQEQILHLQKCCSSSTTALVAAFPPPQRPSGAFGRCARHAERTGRRRTPQATANLGHVGSEAPVTLTPVRREVTTFAPATIANLGPGYDWLGCAVEGEGDEVTARILPDAPGRVVIEAILNDQGRLPTAPHENCAGIAALETLKLLRAPGCGVALTLKKGLPLGSGMGSSAASAAAAAWAVNELFGRPLAKEALLAPGLASEAAVSGYHADNIAPALLGGFIAIELQNPGNALAGLPQCPPPVRQLRFPGDLWFVLVNPVFEAPTREMRAALSADVPRPLAVHNSAMSAMLVEGILRGDAAMLGRALDSDLLVEPLRGPLIPGFDAVKAAAKAAGAFGCTISGAGPTCVGVVADPWVGQRVAEAMVAAFGAEGHLPVNSVRVARLDQEGARELD